MWKGSRKPGNNCWFRVRGEHSGQRGTMGAFLHPERNTEFVRGECRTWKIFLKLISTRRKNKVTYTKAGRKEDRESAHSNLQGEWQLLVFTH